MAADFFTELNLSAERLCPELITRLRYTAKSMPYPALELMVERDCGLDIVSKRRVCVQIVLQVDQLSFLWVEEPDRVAQHLDHIIARHIILAIALIG